MSPSTPPRRFDPTPIEQSATSSRQPEKLDQEGEQKKPRRFAPEPIEESTRSLKDKKENLSEQVEKKAPRRFAPEPIEHSAKSSKDRKAAEEDHDKTPKPRRFVPQVVEETHVNSKHRANEEKSNRVRFKPEPISVEYGSNRKRPISNNNSNTSSATDLSEDGQKTPRKFTPILLDTAKRSRRAGDATPAISQSDKTEYAYHLHHPEHWKRVNEERSQPAITGLWTAPAAAAANATANNERSPRTDANETSQLRAVSPLDGSAPRRSEALARSHSFRMPDLDTIDSSESERDSDPSRLSSPIERESSPFTASESSFEYFKHATRIRESIDEDFSQYLLELERKEMERKELERQVLAAYPNPDFGYEPPDHYINDDVGSDDAEIEERPATWEGHDEDEDHEVHAKRPRRDSTEAVPWEQLEMQRHAEMLQQERNANRITHKPTDEREIRDELPPFQRRDSPASPWWKPPIVDGVDTSVVSPEMKTMRDGARPPMLGGDLVFPRCRSPGPARFDVTQGSVALRNKLYADAAAAEQEKRENEGQGCCLWNAYPTSVSPKAPRSPVWTMKSPIASKFPSQTKGLWGGFCAVDDDSETAGVRPPPTTGLMTPMVENNNPFDVLHPEGRASGIMTPTTPPAQQMPEMQQLDFVLLTDYQREAALDRDFPDSFITQVYNYLSLGYPALARPFDEELSKISGVPIAELRQDDVTARQSPRGYIRLGSDFEGGEGEGEVGEVDCARWRALKMYVREWGRQEKGMRGSNGGDWGHGTTMRRGSWGI